MIILVVVGYDDDYGKNVVWNRNGTERNVRKVFGIYLNKELEFFSDKVIYCFHSMITGTV